MDVRVGDADRRQAVEMLQGHYVDGRLSIEELDERVGRAYSARTFADLDDLQRDLPRMELTPTSSRRRARGQGFRAHATTYLLVMVMLVAIWALSSPGGYFWPIWPMLGWGIGLASHALGGGKCGTRHSDATRSAA